MIDELKARKESLEKDIEQHNSLIVSLESNLKKLESAKASMKGGIIEIDKTILALEKQLKEEE